jgi:hypothetical protein
MEGSRVRKPMATLRTRPEARTRTAMRRGSPSRLGRRLSRRSRRVRT